MSTLDAFVRANNLFTVDLARHMNGDHNVVVSPLSTIIALALICLGAEDTSETQMKQVLHFGNCRDIHYGIQELMFVLQGTKDYKLDIENTLFVEETADMSEAYIDTANAWYNSKPERTGFRNTPKDTWERINLWLKEKSEGTFQIMPETLISNNTKIVVVNTAYLLANWTQNFPKHKTKNERFTLRNNEKVPIQLMSVQGKYNLQTIENEKLRILELPYGKTQTLCMYVILPDNKDNLYNIVENLTYEKLTQWTDSKQMKKKYTKVFLPRFEIDSTYSMKDILTSLGMPDVFNDTNANFTGISRDNLSVSDVISLATVEADEDGTKDVTNYDNLGFLALMLPEVTFRIDQPFMYVIQHKPTKCYVFYGTFQKP